MDKQNKKDTEEQSLSGKDFLIVLGIIIIVGILWALLVTLVPKSAFVAFMIVMFFVFILGPIFYFRKNGILKGSFRIKKSNGKSFWDREI